MTTVSCFIFDLDGTLVDSSEDIANSVNYTLKTLGFPERSQEEVQNFVGDGMKTLLSRATGSGKESFLQKAIGIFQSHYLQHCLDTTQLYPGASEILSYFQTKKMGLVSNKPYEMVLKTLRHFSMQKFFSVILGGESTAQKKPHPEPVLKSLEMMQVPAPSALVVGDGTTDIHAGKSAGALTCAVTYGYRSRKELENLNPNFVIDRIADLKKIIC